MLILSCPPCAWLALCTWHWHFCASRRTESRWEPWCLLVWFGLDRIGLGLAVCRCPLAPVLKSLLALASARLCDEALPRQLLLLSSHTPTHRGRAFPGPAHFPTRTAWDAGVLAAIGRCRWWSRGCCSLLSPCGELTSGDLGGREPSRQSRLRRRRTEQPDTQRRKKINHAAAQTTSRQSPADNWWSPLLLMYFPVGERTACLLL